MFFDAHLHLIYPAKLKYPWLESVPALNAPSPFEAYLLKANRLGISRCLHMEVDVAETDIRAETELIADLTQKHSTMVGAISSCRPENKEFPAFLEWAQRQSTIKGLRRVLHTVPDELSLSAQFRKNLRRLSDTDLTFDLHILPRQIDLGLALVDACPDVHFILNHCGVPNIAKGDFENWAVGISKLAERPNVTGKISGLIAYARPESWCLDDIRPYFEHTTEAFGHDRIIWGSDSPVCNLGGGLETWVAATQALTSAWQITDRNKLYSNNANAIWID